MSNEGSEISNRQIVENCAETDHKMEESANLFDYGMTSCKETKIFQKLMSCARHAALRSEGALSLDRQWHSFLPMRAAFDPYMSYSAKRRIRYLRIPLLIIGKDFYCDPSRIMARLQDVASAPKFSIMLANAAYKSDSASSLDLESGLYTSRSRAAFIVGWSSTARLIFGPLGCVQFPIDVAGQEIVIADQFRLFASFGKKYRFACVGGIV